MIFCNSIKQSVGTLVKLGCSIAFLIQIVMLTTEQIYPSKTVSFREQKSLHLIEFPVIFKLCFKNAFNLEEIENFGYSSVFNYFQGNSRYDEDQMIYGWGGHGKNGSMGLGIKGKEKVFKIVLSHYNQ